MNEVCAPGQALERARALADRIAANAPLAVRESRKIALETVDAPDEEGWKRSGEGMMSLASTEDFAEGPRHSSRSGRPNGRAADSGHVIVSRMPCSCRNSARPSTSGRSATSCERNPRRFGCVVAGDGLGGRIQQRHHEVQDHEVVAVADPLDPADELAAHAFEPGLFGELAHDGLGQQLARLDSPTGHRPEPRGGTVAAADQQQLLVLDDDGADADLRALHGLTAAIGGR